MMTIPSAPGEQCEVAGQRRRSDRVQHDIHGRSGPIVFRSSPQRLSLDEWIAKSAPACLIAATFFPGAGRRGNPGAQVFRDLDRREPNARGTGVNERGAAAP